jgi:hypothetical protein
VTVLNLTGIRDFKISSCFGVGGWNLGMSCGGGHFTTEQRGEEGENMMVWLRIRRRRRQ